MRDCKAVHSGLTKTDSVADYLGKIGNCPQENTVLIKSVTGPPVSRVVLIPGNLYVQVGAR